LIHLTRAIEATLQVFRQAELTNFTKNSLLMNESLTFSHHRRSAAPNVSHHRCRSHVRHLARALSTVSRYDERDSAA
jgi:hypothetical protein